MSRKRFVVECEWSGYTSRQQRVVHRTVETTFREVYEALRWHHFSDGTGMSISVRDAKPRERVAQIRGYSSLLRDLVHQKYIELRDSQSAKLSEPVDK